jgi:hypothetical protein
VPPWAWALIFVAVLCAIAAGYDVLARRKRRGLTKYGSPPGGDRIEQVERTQPGAVQRGEGMRGGGGLSG